MAFVVFVVFRLRQTDVSLNVWVACACGVVVVFFVVCGCWGHCWVSLYTVRS